jgi:hypothetical protein
MDSPKRYSKDGSRGTMQKADAYTSAWVYKGVKGWLAKGSRNCSYNDHAM